MEGKDGGPLSGGGETTGDHIYMYAIRAGLLGKLAILEEHVVFPSSQALGSENHECS